MQKVFYKISAKDFNVGEHRKSEYDIDDKRIKDFNEKKEFLELFYFITNSKPKKLNQVNNDIKNGYANNIESSYNEVIPILHKLYKKNSFDLSNDFYLILDYYLMKEKEKLEIESFDLPDRFSSSFFFKTKEDCLKYLNKLNYNKCFIYKVEIKDLDSIYKFDNNFISTNLMFLSGVELSMRCFDFLFGKEESNDPIFEYVYKGEYRVIDKEDIKKKKSFLDTIKGLFG